METLQLHNATVSYVEDDTHYYFTVTRDGVTIKKMSFDKDVTDLSEAVEWAKDIASNYYIIDGISHYTYISCRLNGQFFASDVWCAYEEAQLRAQSVDCLHVCYSIAGYDVTVKADYRYKYMTVQILKYNNIVDEFILNSLDGRSLFNRLADMFDN